MARKIPNLRKFRSLGVFEFSVVLISQIFRVKRLEKFGAGYRKIRPSENFDRKFRITENFDISNH